MILDLIEQARIVPVVKLQNAEDTLPLLDALAAGGIHVAEITFRTDCAEECIRIGASHRPNMLIGAGTVLTAEQAERAIVAGAQFVVSPGFSDAVAGVCARRGILYLGGAVTPTEIMHAIDCGATVIKYFPAAEFGGVRTLRALSAVFRGVRFLPTGGINADNVQEYLALPSVIACGGSWMVKDTSDLARVTELSRQAMEVVGK